MTYLLAVSLVWAFSFGLIKGVLTDLDPNLVACVRMMISFAVFAPLIRSGRIAFRLKTELFLLGMCQFGLMYSAYIYSYQYLKAYEVALFTIFTPLYVALIGDVLSRRFSGLNLMAALLAVCGTGIVMYHGFERLNIMTGFVLVQFSNLCFAAGQVWYRRVMARNPNLKDRQVFGILYLGAMCVTAFAAVISTSLEIQPITLKQVLTLLYLGAVASGICFFAWNYGARQVNVGSLAVMNNLKIPLAVAVSILFFGESVDLPGLLIGGIIVISALVITEFNSLKRLVRKTEHAERT